MSKLTQKALANAVTELLEEKSLDKITIKDITDTCGVTRNTFYYHFRDVYDLLSWIFINQADEIVKQHQDSRKWEEGFLSGLNYLYEHKNMINHVYRSISREDLQRFLHQVIGRYILELIELQSGGIKVKDAAKKIAADFYKNAFTGAIFQWIGEDMKTDPAKMAVLCNCLFKGTIEQTLLSAENALNQMS